MNNKKINTPVIGVIIIVALTMSIFLKQGVTPNVILEYNFPTSVKVEIGGNCTETLKIE